MRLARVLGILLVLALLAWAVEIVCIVYRNETVARRIGFEGVLKREQLKLSHKSMLRELEEEYELKKHLAAGETVFERIYNKEDQSIIDLIKGISQESLPEDWNCEVRAEEFTHFILLVYLPRDSKRPSPERLTVCFQPIIEYCRPYLSDIAVFDGRHKSFIYFDEPLLLRLEDDELITKETLAAAETNGELFTRLDSVTVECERFESHLLVPIEIAGAEGILSFRALLDTGASMTMLSKGIVSATGFDDLQNAPRHRFSTASGIISCPVVTRNLCVGGIDRQISVAVNLNDDLNLIGMNFFEGMDYVVDFREPAIYIWRK